MTVALAPDLQRARLAATLNALGAGARVTLHDGQMPVNGPTGQGPDGGDGGDGTAPDPASPSAAPALVQVALADPPGVIAQGQIVLLPAAPTGVLVTTSGVARWARITTADGAWRLDCTVSGPAGDGDWKIAIEGQDDTATEARLYQGGTFILGTVTLC